MADDNLDVGAPGAEGELSDVDFLAEGEPTEPESSTDGAGEDEGGEGSEDSGAGEGGLEEPESSDSSESVEGDKPPKKAQDEESLTEEEQALLGQTPYQAIKTKYPKLFKEFPELRQTFFREQQYSELFPTVDDARDAAERVGVLAPIEQGLLAGRAAELVESLARTDERVLQSVAKDFLPKLYAQNKEAFYSAVDPVLKNFIRSALAKGEKESNANLINAAKWMSNFAYGTFEPPTAEEPPARPDPERERLEREKQEFFNARYQQARTEVLEGSVGQLIREVQKTIDPEKKATDYMRDVLTQRVMEELDTVLQSDRRHMNQMNSLWRRGMAAGMTPDWKARIKNAYLARAKTVLPQIRAKVRRDSGLYSGKASPRPNNQSNSTGEGPKRIPAGPPASLRAKGSVSPKDVDWSRTSDMDILNDRYIPRRK